MSTRKPFVMRRNKCKDALPKRPCAPREPTNARPDHALIEWRGIRARARDCRAMPSYLVDNVNTACLTDREVAILRAVRGSDDAGEPLFDPLLTGRFELESLLYRETPVPKSATNRAVQLASDKECRAALQSLPATKHFEAAMTVYAVDCVEDEMMEEGEQLAPERRAPWNDGCEELKRFYDYAGSFWDWTMYLQTHVYAVRAGKALAAERRRLRRDPELDCWLILVWPLVRKYQWTFTDVEIARRMRFDNAPKKLRFGSPGMREWEQRQIKVDRAARKRIKDRGKGLGLLAKAVTGRPKGVRSIPLMAYLACRIAPGSGNLLP